MKKIDILPYYKGDIIGIDVVVHDKWATVEDFTSSLDDYIIKGKLTRVRSSNTQCEGCDICCQERIPLTSLDVFRLNKTLNKGLDLNEFLKRYTYVYVSERAVDISLRRDIEEKCIFLDKSTGKCSHYLSRPFVCRTYICTLLSQRAEGLRNTIVNTGEDELVRLWLEAGRKEFEGPIMHEAYNPCVKEDDWCISHWTDKKDYNEVYIKDIVQPKLWNKLTEGEKSV